MTFNPEDANSCVYKILRKDEWDKLRLNGEFLGSMDDIQDGFIHLSNSEQIEGTKEKHFRNVRPLFVLRFDTPIFLEKLTWEKSKTGERYPHLYNRPICIDDFSTLEVIR